MRVSGPLGKNLGIEPSGLNVAFAAGTGILPFMDLVGFIARHTVNLTQFDSARLAPNTFHFWCNVRANSYEKIGDDLLQAVATANPEMFTYDTGLDGRWTRETIEDKLQEISEKTQGRIPINIWVCGPPVMN